MQNALDAANFRSGTDYRAIRVGLGGKGFPPSKPHALESLKGPGYSNILLHNFLLHGPHPGASSAEIVQNLTPLLRAGVTTFVCMQQEVPSVATKEAVSTRSNFGGSTVVTSKNYMGIAQAIVDAGGYPTTGGMPLSFVHAPVSTYGGAAPNGHTASAGGVIDDDRMKSLVIDLLGHMKSGEYLYLHCSDGNGRSGVAAALLMGLAHSVGPVEALSMCQKSRNDRPGAQGASPETHEQRMQVHRIMSDASFVAAARAVTPKASDTEGRETAVQLDGVLRKIRGIATRKGLTSLIHLKRYGARLAGAGHTILGNQVGGEISRQVFDKMCSDAEWYLTADEAASLWAASVTASVGNAAPGNAAVPAIFRVVRGALKADRATAVHDAFKRLSAGMATVRLDTLAALFLAQGHPDVKANKRRADEVASEFLDTFGVQARTERVGGGMGARSVGAEEFEDYYSDISAAVTDDAYFEMIMFGCWPSGPGGSVNDSGTGGGMDSGGKTARQQRMLKIDPHVTASIGRQPTGAAIGHKSIFNDAVIQGMLKKSTDSGFTYSDIRDMDVALMALRRHLASVSEFAVAHLGATLRRADIDRDGFIDAYDLRGALRDTIAACAQGVSSATASAHPATGRAAHLAMSRAASGGTALPTAGPGSLSDHPFMVSDADCNAVFEAVVSRLTPSTLTTGRPIIPLEKMHALLRGALPEYRRTTVHSIFNTLDRDGSGSVPVSDIMLAFRAEDHPAVTSGRASVPVMYRLFQDSFGEGFSLVDKHGASLRLTGGPAAEAYYGHGDGRVRLSFWEAWHEALASAFQEDAAFNLVAFHVWSGGNAAMRRAGRGQATGVLPGSIAGGAGPTGGPIGARFDPRVMAAKAEDGEAGLLSSMSRLGGLGGGQGSGQGGGGGHGGRAVPGAWAGGASTGSSPRRMGALSRMEAESGTASGLGGRIAGSNPASGFFSSEMGAVAPRDNPLERARTAPAHTRTPASMNDPEYDGALGAARAQLQRGGAKRAYALVRSLEAASLSLATSGHGGSYDGSLSAPMPAHALTAVLRDNSLGLSPRQLEAVTSRLDPSNSGYLTPVDFILHLAGPLPPPRAQVVRAAYEHVARRAAEAAGAVGSLDGAGHALPPPPLEEVRMLYRSAAHGDVKSGKRGEEDVLREFLETYDGHTFTCGVGPESGSTPSLVTLAGFTTYFSLLSMLTPHDGHFATQLYDVWGMYEARAPAHAAASRPAGGSGGYGYGQASVANAVFGQADAASVYGRHGAQAAAGADAGGQFVGGRGPGQQPLHAAAYAQAPDGKADLTMAKRGWGVESGRY